MLTVFDKLRAILSEMEALSALAEDPQIPEAVKLTLGEMVVKVADLCAGISEDIAADK